MVGSSGRSPRSHRRARIAIAAVVIACTGGAIAQARFLPAPASPYTTDSEPGSALPGDFNGDARTDLAVVNGTSSTVQFFDQISGSNGFGLDAASSFAVDPGPSVPTVADFNGDTRPDVAV